MVWALSAYALAVASLLILILFDKFLFSNPCLPLLSLLQERAAFFCFILEIGNEACEHTLSDK